MRSPRPFLTALLLIAGACHINNPAARAVDEPAKSGGEATISGKIVDASAAPIAGAKVTLHRLESLNSRWGRFKIERAAAAADGAGTYKFSGLGDGYFMLSVAGPGFPRTFRAASIQDHASQHADIVLKAPVSLVIRVEDQDGKPVAGAHVREITQRGVNGECSLRQLWLRSLGVSIPSSDVEGFLRLPPLPSGEIIKATIDHPRLAPVRTGDLTAAPGAAATVKMQPGVAVTLHVPVDPPAERIPRAVVDLRHQPFDDPSTIIYYEVEFDRNGTAQLTVAPGDYSWLLLQHENFFLTPVYSANHQKKNWLRIEPGRNQGLHLDVHRKVSVRGRVVDADTGKPRYNMSVMGELAHRTSPPGWADPPPDKWSFAGWAETDVQGRYTIDLAAGLARVSFQGSEFVAEQDYYEVSVAADGSTVIPDIKIRALQKIKGVVQNPDGTPAPRAVLRLRGKSMRGLQPVLTNDAGRFEVRPQWIPVDQDTGKRAFHQHVVAFDPYRPLAARAEVRLDQPKEIVLKLEPHDPDWPLAAFESELSDWERGIVPAAKAAKDAAVSMCGQAAPEIDSALWLNTNDRTLSLADLRGKYVLLDFWFIGCGPCHADFPLVKLVHELYKDKGVVVIGVHNNSSPPEAVRKHVARIGLPFPVAVDHPDGRTIARFEEHGVPAGYPDYVLISPEGKVLLDDRTIPHPALRSYKLEIIRKLLLESQETGQ
jgi:thiol-disulfide isomerase/thioredoxin